MLNYNDFAFPTSHMNEQNEYIVYEFGSFRVDTKRTEFVHDILVLLIHMTGRESKVIIVQHAAPRKTFVFHKISQNLRTLLDLSGDYFGMDLFRIKPLERILAEAEETG